MSRTGVRSGAKRAVFLDRDGTIIDDTGFIRRVEDVKLLPDAAEAIRRLNAAGWAVVVVTNQSGVARGLLTEKDVEATNQRMIDLLRKEKAHVDAIYHCPHLPEGKVSEYAVVCECRKPRPGMLLKAAEDHNIDLSSSMTIGDAARDVEAGLAAGTKAILLTQSPTRADEAPDACGQAPDLPTAVNELIEFTSGEAPVEPEVKAGAAEPAEEGERPAEEVEVEAAKPGRRSRRRIEPTQEKPDQPQTEAAAVTPEKEKPVSDKEESIPVHRAPKEFTPEPEVPEEVALAPAPRQAGAVEKPAAPPPREEPPRLAGVLQCGRCGRIIPLVDVEAGKAVDKDGVRLCGECVVVLAAQKTRPKEISSEDIHRELQNICRALTYEKFSYWNVFGAIAQALAIGSLIETWRLAALPEGLLWAIFFQLLTLTLFILGRR